MTCRYKLALLEDVERAAGHMLVTTWSHSKYTPHWRLASMSPICKPPFSSDEP